MLANECDEKISQGQRSTLSSISKPSTEKEREKWNEMKMKVEKQPPKGEIIAPIVNITWCFATNASSGKQHARGHHVGA